MIIQLVYTPVMIRLLGQNEYGLYTLVGSVVSYLSLFSFGFTGAYLRFYSRYRAEGKRFDIAKLNGIFLSLFLGMSILAVVCGMVLAQYTPQLFGSKLTIAEIQKAKILMRISVVNIALTFPSAVFDSIVSAHECFLFQRVLHLAGILFNPLICLPLLLYGYDSIAIVVVTTIITVTKLVVNIWFCIVKLHVPFLFCKFDFSLLKEISHFSFFLFINMVIDQINWSIDKYILGRLAGTASVAVYEVGAQFNAMCISLSAAVSTVFAPWVNRVAAENAEDMKQRFTRIFVKVGRVQFLILALVTSGFVVFGKYFITDIYTNPDYSDAYGVTLFLILPVMIPLIQNLGIEIQRAVNKHQFRSLVYLLMAGANIVISIPLAKNYGPIGSAMGTAISLLVANGFIMNVYYHKAIGIDVIAFWKSILHLAKGMIIPAILGAGIMYFVRFPDIFAFAVWILIYALVYVFSFWKFGMNQEEKTMVISMISKMRGRH